ncbi:MAG: NERD domain-containing protein [Spartobacteria bacterium]|nr:NERD domain-containing protein [Spartobacteria bacterium]
MRTQRRRNEQVKESVISENKVATIYGSPGIHPRFVWLVRYFLPLIPILFACGYCIRALFPLPAMSSSTAGTVLLIMCGGFWFLMRKANNAYTGFVKGARGEERTAQTLRLLSHDFTVFHGVNVTGGKNDVDHLVIGPTGVLVIETKNWSGEIKVEQQEILYNGMKPSRPPLDQVKKAAQQVAAMLGTDDGLDVTPVLCFISGEHAVKTAGVSGVIITSPEHLLDVVRQNSVVSVNPDQTLKLIEKVKQCMEKYHD